MANCAVDLAIVNGTKNWCERQIKGGTNDQQSLSALEMLLMR